MRILMLLYNQTGKGTYWRADHLGRALVERGHRVTLVSTAPRARLKLQVWHAGDFTRVETPDLLPGALRSGWDPYNTLRRLAWLRNQTFDVAHAFETRPVVIYPALAAQQRGARLFFDWCDWFGRGGSVEERPNPLVRAVLRPVETYFEEHFRGRAAGTTVINTFLRQRAIALGVPPADVLLLRNGSTLDHPPQDMAAARRKTGLPPDIPLIGYIGGAYENDARLMAAAFNRLLAVEPRARLALAGYFNRPIEAWLDRPEAVIRTGRLDYPALFDVLSACQVCWLPLTDSGANRGRWPLKLNDYMSAGRPVVATQVGDLQAVIARHELGVSVPPEPEAIAAATQALLNDPPRAAALGRAARRAAETHIRWAQLAVELEDFYRRSLAAPPDQG